MSVTGHCIDENFEQQVVVLRVTPFPESHTAANISSLIEEVIEEFKIPASKIHLIAHDNGANVVKAVKMLPYSSLPCFLHTLQLVINDCIFEQRPVKEIIANCRTIVGHFNHSPQAYNKLEKLQDENNVMKHKLIQNVPTRWNSTFHMLQRIFEQKKVLALYMIDNPQLPSFDANKWSLIGNLSILLKVFHNVTVRLSERRCLASDILPQVQFLKLFTEKAKTDIRLTGMKATINSAEASMYEQFEKYNDDDNLILATFLDPRYKMEFFGETNELEGQSNKKNKNYIINSLQKAAETIRHLNDMETDSILATSGSDTDSINDPLENISTEEERINIPEYDYDVCFDELRATKTQTNTSKKQEKQKASDNFFSTLKREIDAYCADDIIDKKSDPLLWWNVNKEKMPSLANLAKKFLSCPPSSVESERLFSIGGNIYTSKRSSLTPDHGEMLMFLNFNLRIFDFKYD